MDLLTAQSKVGSGWSQLIEKYFTQISYLAKWDVEVTEVKNRIGMLSITAQSPFGSVQQILNSLSWTIERESAKVCETCGSKGFRRKLIPGSPNMCQKHYVEYINRQEG